MSSILISLSIVIPNFSSSFNFTRFYAFGLLVLAPCFALGGEALTKIFGKIWAKIRNHHFSEKTLVTARNILLSVVIVGFLLSQSGFINHIANASPLSYPLDQNRMQESTDTNLVIGYYSTYIPESDVAGASWLSKNAGSLSTIYGDLLSRFGVLTSYGLFPRQETDFIGNTTVLTNSSFLYLGQMNVVAGIISAENSHFNSSELLPLLRDNNLVYSNRNCEIWKAVPSG